MERGGGIGGQLTGGGAGGDSAYLPTFTNFGLRGRHDPVYVHSIQVIHDAVDNLLACHQKSGTTAAGQETPLLPCTCEDRKHTRCFCGLEEYVLASNDRSQTSRNDANFDNLVIEIDV